MNMWLHLPLGLSRFAPSVQNVPGWEAFWCLQYGAHPDKPCLVGRLHGVLT